jgi:hypothetical protein
MDQDIRGEEKIQLWLRVKIFTSEVMTLKLKLLINWKESMDFSQRLRELFSLEGLQAAWLS